jgi:hypothetical protein
MGGRRGSPRYFLEVTYRGMPERLIGPILRLLNALLTGAIICVKFAVLVMMPDASADDFVRTMVMILVLPRPLRRFSQAAARLRLPHPSQGRS